MDAPVAIDPAAKGAYNAGQSTSEFDTSIWTGYWPNPKIFLHWEAPAFVGLNNCLNLNNHGWQDASPRGGGSSFCFTGWK